MECESGFLIKNKMKETIHYLTLRIQALEQRIKELESINNIEVIDAKIL